MELEAKEFCPSLPASELALQIATAILECSDKRFLPEPFKKLDRAMLQRYVSIAGEGM